MEGGTTVGNMQPMGELEMINDEGYNTFSVKVFRKNFNRMKE